jgi:PHD/YefM family antitoxin component YafN of YafNO toxin-antitoxin module
MLKTTSITELRDNLAGTIDSLQNLQTIMVLRNSKAAAYLVEPEYFEQLLEQIEDLMDIAEMQLAIEDYRNGDAVEAEDVFNRLGI